MSLTLAEARARAALLSDVPYDVSTSTSPTGRPSASAPTVSVRLRASRAPTTFLELTDAREVLVDGRRGATYDGRPDRAHRPGGRRNEVRVEARLPYVTDGDGMHTFTDPADGETYVSAYVGMDIAQRVFPCFDQNDLKAPIVLTVTAPEDWTVLANGRQVAGSEGGDWEFATTPPIPLPMFVVCAGPVALGDLGARRARRADAAVRLARARLAGRRARPRRRRAARASPSAASTTTRRSSTEPYPFDSYDQAFVPGQNWGALETPGCVTYRDEYPRRSAPPTERRAARPGDVSPTRWRTCGSATWSR